MFNQRSWRRGVASTSPTNKLLARNMRHPGTASLHAPSGTSGVFITPKNSDAFPDGTSEVVRLDADDVTQALAVAKVRAASLGLARGRGNLGIREAADNYAVTQLPGKPSSRAGENVYSM